MVHFDLFRFSKRRLLVFILTAMVFALAIYVVNNLLPFYDVWSGYRAESDIGTYFCEQTFMEKVVRQPINTFSNVVYLMAALIVLRRGWKDQSKKTRYNIVSANPFYSITYGVILLYTFCASTFFHSSLIHFASRLDFSAVYSLALFPMMYFTHRLWLLSLGLPSNQKHSKSLYTVIAVFSVLYFAFTFGVPDGWDDQVVFALIWIMVIMGAILERKDPGRTNRSYLVICIAAIMIAIVWFVFDTHKILCNPDSVLQPHSLWHLFAGTSTFYFYLYIRSEKNKI